MNVMRLGITIIVALIIVTTGAIFMVPRIRADKTEVANLQQQIEQTKMRIDQMQKVAQSAAQEEAANKRSIQRYQAIIQTVKNTQTIQDSITALYAAIEHSRVANHLVYTSQSTCDIQDGCTVSLSGTYQQMVQFLASMYRSSSLAQLQSLNIGPQLTSFTQTQSGQSNQVTGKFVFVPFIIVRQAPLPAPSASPQATTS